MMSERRGPRRQVQSPVFLLSPIRSGSTLLRCLLNAHPDIYAPHELHLRHLRVGLENEYVELAMRHAGVTVPELQYILWDGLLKRLLSDSGKRLIVDKSPSNVWIWRRLIECWPDSRFILLRRNPAAIADSIVRADDGRDLAEATGLVARFADELDRAERHLPIALSLRYETLTADPTTVCRSLCEVLEVPWKPAVLDYGLQDHGPFVYGIGDWSSQIRSGRVQAARPAPPWQEQSAPLRELCRRWGYGPDGYELEG